MGYAMPQQTTRGIHFRQYSRAFIFADEAKKNRVVFVNMDICMGTQAIKMQVWCVAMSRIDESLHVCRCCVIPATEGRGVN